MSTGMCWGVYFLFLLGCMSATGAAQAELTRARDLGIPFSGETGDLNVVVARDENGDLRGIAPLFFTRNLDNKPALMFLGSNSLSECSKICISS